MKSMFVRLGAFVAVLAIVIVVGLWLRPATAHLDSPRYLWNKHLRPLADARYLQNTKVFVFPFTLGSLADLTVTQSCPAGWQAIGGGVDFESANADVRVISDAPTLAGAAMFDAAEGKNPAGDGWRVTMHNNGLLAVDGAVGAICSR